MTSLLLVLFSGIGQCKENPKAGDDGTASPAPTQFLVTLSEYHLEKSIPVDADEAKILEIVRESGASPYETVRMTAAADTESMVNFGRQITVTTGKVARGPITSRETQTVQIGTILQVRIASHGDGAMAEISYTTSRLDGNGTDDSTPDVLTNTVQATQIYVLGEQRLLSTSSVGKAPCIVVSIQQIP